MKLFWVELILTIWGAFSLRMINRQQRFGLISGIVCNCCFLAYWGINHMFGFMVGDLIYTAVYAREIYVKFYKTEKQINEVF